jgi:glycosyltransferase involved in cell wall biosynthesis
MVTLRYASTVPSTADKMDEKKNILFITSSMKIGGAEKIVADLILGLAKRGYKAILICIKTLDYWGEFLRNHGIDCYVLHLKRQWDFLKIGKLVYLSAMQRPDIIFCLDHRDAIFWSRLLAFFLRRPHILSQHSLKIAGAEAPNRVQYRWMIKATTPLSSKIVVCSDAVKSYLIRIGISPKRIRVIHNGVSMNKQDKIVEKINWRSRMRIPPGAKLVGIVAALRPIKSHDVFLAAAKHVLEYCPLTYFAIIGDGYMRADLKKMAESLSISNHVFFLGNITPASDIIRSLDIGVLSSKKEAFPMVILEYMEAGIPVISTNSGGPSEMILERETGFLIPVCRPELMARKIIYLIKNEAVSAQMGKVGRERVRQYFSLDKMINQYVDLFRQYLHY